MPRKITPISIHQYTYFGNCLDFATGHILSTKTRNDSDLDYSFPIAEAFLKKLSERGYELPRQIQDESEAREGECILKVFDFTDFEQEHPLWKGETITFKDFHVVRRELDGTWVHKPGWDDSPCEIRTDEDWAAIYEEFGNKFVLFAFEPETES